MHSTMGFRVAESGVQDFCIPEHTDALAHAQSTQPDGNFAHVYDGCAFCGPPDQRTQNSPASQVSEPHATLPQ
jgi:hypothetical protein